ncbi:MAG: hypothetical protein JWO25_2972 [Alphaproteobacteria bacterium]|nr:hypothetical protein [Alphaproteobacteria bacterium]
MSKQDRIRHHRNRAEEELERARAAACEEAAIAHLRLSELHLGAVQALLRSDAWAPTLVAVA